MRRLVIFILLTAVVGALAASRWSSAKEHGTPDAWPAVPRKA